MIIKKIHMISGNNLEPQKGEVFDLVYPYLEDEDGEWVSVNMNGQLHSAIRAD